jgi:hypothetical protein
MPISKVSDWKSATFPTFPLNFKAQVDDQNFQVLNADIMAVINGVNQLIQITQNVQNMVQNLSAAFRYQ